MPRARAIDRVFAALEASVDMATGLELVRVAERVLAIADAESIGPGTPRMTMAGAAVYAADRLTDGKAVTQAEVVEAVEQTVPTSRWKIKSYASRVYEASESRLEPMARVPEVVSAD